MIGPVQSAGDDLDAELVLSLEPLGALAQFNRARVLAAADVHVATALGRLGGDNDELVGLAVALAVRAPRVGHVLVDLATIRETAVAGSGEDADLTDLPWPSLGHWLERVSGSPLVAMGDNGPDDRPLRLVGSRLYLDRYWQDEQDVAVDLTARSAASAPDIDDALLAEGLARLYPQDSSGLQRQAASTVLHRFLTVIAGGPGTGKTTTVARVLALVAEQAVETGQPLPMVALVAPTGKAAARMAEAVHGEARRLDVGEAVRGWLLSLDASTVHRLLGRRPGTATRFRHDGSNQLPYEVVVVDETSMMSLPLMARLVDAVRKEARLVLIGDQEQLASVEAGAVLGDIVGPAATAVGPSFTSGAAGPRDASPGGPNSGEATPVECPPIAQCITVLQANYRFRGPLAELALAVRSGNADTVMAVLEAERSASRDALDGDSHARWLDIDVGTSQSESLEPVRSAVLMAQQLVVQAARAGDAPAALDALGRLRLLCAHRDGPPAPPPGTLRPNNGWQASAKARPRREAGTSAGQS